MIIEFLLNETELTNAERSIAKYLLDKNNTINHLTSSELGRLSYTSQAAVTRLYKKLGYKNFREFLSAFIIERKDYFQFDEIKLDHPEEYLATLDDIQAVITSLYLKSITKTNALLNKNVLTRLTNYIMSAQMIDIYGMGFSETVAKQFTYKLQSLGLPCSYQKHFILKYVENMRHPQNKVSIMICIEKSNDAMKELAKVMNGKGIYTVAIVTHQDDDIRDICKDYLMFDTSDFKDVEHITSTFSADYVANIIYAMVTYRMVLSQYTKDK